MATVIRFARFGTKKRPYFRIVVADHRKPRDGRYIEHIGAYNPQKKQLSVKRDRLEYWLSVGAIASTSVSNQLKKSRGQAATPPAAPKKKSSKKSKAEKSPETTTA